MGTRRQLFNLNLSRDIPEFNIVLLGALGVGKSALTVKYITGRFIMEYDPTLEDTYTKSENIDGQDVTVKIMDTYDDDDSNPDRYLKWAQGFIVVYSITSRPSFDIARSYLDSVNQFHKITGKELSVALVGNKVDLERYRTVSKAAGQDLANEYDCSFQETSAAEDFDSVENVLHLTIKDIARANDSQIGLPLQPLFISEEKASLLNPVSQVHSGRTSLRRVKAPKTHDVKENKRDDKDTGSRVVTRRTAPGTFRIFNKSWKIFN